MAKPVIFVVDDDQNARKVVARDLNSRYAPRYRILEAASGSDALKTLRQLRDKTEPVALILSSQQLPDGSGVEFLKRANEIFPDARRALLTPFSQTESAIEAIENYRIDDYLVTPCHPAEQKLYPAVNDLLADWEARTNPPVEGVRVVGSRFSPEAHQIRDFLARNCVPFDWLDIERDEEARRLLDSEDQKASRLPIVIFPDGTRLVQPTNAKLATKIGLKVHPDDSFYDLIIVGGGPAGLASSVYGASEGLHTVMVERHAPGGQAGLSSMIENYLGFPAGLSGADLARRAVAQAKKFEVEIVSPQVVTSLRADGSSRIVTLSDGTELHCHVVLLATGVEWRRLDVPGLHRLVGAGVYYGGTLAEAFFCRNEDVYIVGGANSAGQAAVYFSRYARTVTILVRENSLSQSMSRYLIDQIESTKNIKVRLRTTVVEVQGDERLEAITVLDATSGEKEFLRTNALFIFIGALPHTEWLAKVVETDDHGFILTGPDLARLRGNGHVPRNWALARDPFWLESSQPGIFVAGDVRHGSVKRVAAGVGEGATAVQFIHQYLASVER
jgi:thioredoxin reductase (NADPH)